MMSTKFFAAVSLAVAAAAAHAGPFAAAEHTGTISYTATQSGVSNPSAITWSNDPVPIRDFVRGFVFMPTINVNPWATEQPVGGGTYVQSGSDVYDNFGPATKVVSDGGQLTSGSTSVSGIFDPAGTAIVKFSISARVTPTTARMSTGSSANLQIIRAFVIPPLTSVTFTLTGVQNNSIKVSATDRMSPSLNSTLALMQKAADGVYDRLTAYTVSNSTSLPSTTTVNSFTTQSRTLTLTYNNTSGVPVSLALLANAKGYTSNYPN